MFEAALLASSASCGGFAYVLSSFKLTKRGESVMLYSTVLAISLFFSFATVWNMP